MHLHCDWVCSQLVSSPPSLSRTLSQSVSLYTTLLWLFAAAEVIKAAAALYYCETSGKSTKNNSINLSLGQTNVEFAVVYLSVC